MMPAFPQPMATNASDDLVFAGQYGLGGMSLHDYVAIAILAGFSLREVGSIAQDVSEAFLFADEFMRQHAERSKQGGAT